MVWEKHACEEGVNRNLGRAAHERCQEDGAPTVVGGVEGACRHHSGHGAAEANEHGHDAVASETKLSQKTVADEGHTRHVAAVLQEAEEEKQQDNNRYKAQHTAHATKDAVDDKRLHGWTDIPTSQGITTNAAKPRDALVEPILQRRAKHIDAEPDDAYHHEDEDGDGSPFSGEDAVNAAAALVFLAFLGLDDGPVAKPFDEGKTHLSHGSGTVEAALLFHL